MDDKNDLITQTFNDKIDLLKVEIVEKGTWQEKRLRQVDDARTATRAVELENLEKKMEKHVKLKIKELREEITTSYKNLVKKETTSVTQSVK